jgi:hypothetical protein
MNYKIVNRVAGLFVFLFSSIVYLLTVQPTLSFWDCGEFLACAFTLSTPHPPGAPLHILVGKIFTMFPTATDIGLRMNLLSVFSSSISVMLVYLISTKLIKNWRGTPKSTSDILIIAGSSIIGALAFGFCDSFWFNALEAEVYGFGALLTVTCVYFLMLWWEKADEPGSDKYLLMLMYVVGLAFGIHLLVLQVIPIVGLLYYFKRFEYNFKSMLIAIGASSIAFILVFWLIGQKYPLLISENTVLGILVFLTISAISVYYIFKNKSKTVIFAFLSLFLILLGYSTYISVIQRSSVPDLPLDENNTDTIERLIPYLNREQYGEAPLIMPRRYSHEPQHQRTWNNYTSDMDFMWRYQINEMFNRYLFWQFIGRAGYNQDDGVDFSKFFAIPFILGMLGLFYQFKKDWKLGFALLGMFLIMGVLTALYQNQQDPQPRERDYFYEGAFMTFALWISLGVAAIIDQAKQFIKGGGAVPVTSIILIASFIFVPVNMLRVNYKYQTREGNFLPFDYAYNILQSVDKDAILITNGDNDTFPLWCLQAVYGVRQDVRIINLSLAQIDWYNLQLRNERPYGALTVPMTYTDEQLKNDNMMKMQSRGWDEKKKLYLDIPLSAYPDSLKNKPNLPDKIEYTVAATIRQQQGKQTYGFLKINDYIVMDMLKANKWQRPVYFSVTVTEENYVGLGDYMLMQGMALKIVPYKTTDLNNPNGVAMNRTLMRKHLFDNPVNPSKTPQYGMMFRGLDKGNIFFDETQKRMIETYRSLFIRLAYNYADDSTQSKEAGVVLDHMEKEIPKDAIDMDYRLKYEAAMLYYRIGDINKFNFYADDVEKAINEELKTKKNINTQSYFNPYRLLLDIYEAKGNYQGALNLLDVISKSNPNDASIIQKRESIKQKMSGGQNKKDTSKNTEEEKKYNSQP